MGLVLFVPTLVSIIAICIMVGVLFIAYFRKIAMTYALVVANFIVFFITLVFPIVVYELGFRPAYLSVDYFPNVYTLFTSMFLHGDFWHLFGNMLAFFFMGIAFEQRIGWKKFIVIYLITGVCGALTHSLLNLSSGIVLIGASGAVFGILGAFAFSYPRDEVMMPIPLGIIMIFRRVKVMYAAILFAAMETVFVIIGGRGNTAHFAHFGGLIAGVVLAAILIRDAGPRKTSNSNTLYYDSYAPSHPSKVDFKSLDSLVQTSEQKDLLVRIKAENIPQIRDAWIESFLETSHCPKCKSALKSFEGKIWCDNCGFRTKY